MDPIYLDPDPQNWVRLSKLQMFSVGLNCICQLPADSFSLAITTVSSLYFGGGTDIW